MNKILVWESLKNCIDNRNGVLPVETFKTLLAEGMDAPITEDDWPKLLKIYDKKNEGVLNWEDLITDHKYIHAVSIYTHVAVECIHALLNRLYGMHQTALCIYCTCSYRHSTLQVNLQ